MKKYLIFFLILCSMSLCFAYSKPKKAAGNTDAVTGYIKVYGNEPFTFIGLVTEDEKEYSLKASDEVLAELRKVQGKKIEIKGTIEKSEQLSMNELKDGNLIVLEWKVVK
ncbi:hypothetical protein SAMN04487775_102215 [Treponema bryantii]|uniref:tRNA_anti-like n=1 Tax=Treponema bryantii TaxID=163 RepID=A0A1I3IYG6_9SPIR|nr:hypothetical protein [Treponema bryantii]SFI52940.1 hypothetical protein SAMN04487775_102215 [Treponema bryantii]